MSWSVFRKIRVFIFSLCAFLNFGMAGILSYYLFVQWQGYTELQRGIVLGLTSAEGVSGPILIILIFLRFRVWVDAFGVAIALSLQIAGSVLFTLFNPNFPCVGFGTSKGCRQLSQELTIGAWTLAGLFFGYVTFLGIMACFAPSSNEADVDADFETFYFVTDKKGRDAEKHLSHFTVASFFPREQSTIRGSALSPMGAESILRQQQQTSEYRTTYEPSSPGQYSMFSDGGSGYGSSGLSKQSRMTYASSRIGSISSLSSTPSENRQLRVPRPQRAYSNKSNTRSPAYSQNGSSSPAFAYEPQNSNSLAAVPEDGSYQSAGALSYPAQSRQSIASSIYSSDGYDGDVVPPLPTFAAYPRHQPTPSGTRHS